jgi:hypothetical protein
MVKAVALGGEGNRRSRRRPPCILVVSETPPLGEGVDLIGGHPRPTGRYCRRTGRWTAASSRPRKPLSTHMPMTSRGGDRNRTGVHGFAGRWCLPTVQALTSKTTSSPPQHSCFDARPIRRVHLAPVWLAAKFVIELQQFHPGHCKPTNITPVHCAILSRCSYPMRKNVLFAWTTPSPSTRSNSITADDPQATLFATRLFRPPISGLRRS